MPEAPEGKQHLAILSKVNRYKCRKNPRVSVRDNIFHIRINIYFHITWYYQLNLCVYHQVYFPFRTPYRNRFGAWAEESNQINMDARICIMNVRRYVSADLMATVAHGSQISARYSCRSRSEWNDEHTRTTYTLNREENHHISYKLYSWPLIICRLSIYLIFIFLNSFILCFLHRIIDFHSI